MEQLLGPGVINTKPQSSSQTGSKWTGGETSENRLHVPIPLRVPVMVFGPSQYLPKAFSLGCTDYLTEPWDYPELKARALRNVPPPCIKLGTKRYLLTTSGLTLHSILPPVKVSISPPAQKEKSGKRKRSPLKPLLNYNRALESGQISPKVKPRTGKRSEIPADSAGRQEEAEDSGAKENSPAFTFADSFGKISFPPACRLSHPEVIILGLLISNEDRPVFRETIQYALWGKRSAHSRAVDMHIVSLRKKLNRLAGETGPKGAVPENEHEIKSAEIKSAGQNELPHPHASRQIIITVHSIGYTLAEECRC